MANKSSDTSASEVAEEKAPVAPQPEPELEVLPPDIQPESVRTAGAVTTLAAVEQPVTDLPGELPEGLPENAVLGAFVGIDPGSKGMPANVHGLPLRPTE